MDSGGEFIVTGEGRLDTLMSEYLDRSRSQISKLIRTVGVHIDDSLVMRPSFRLKGGEKVVYRFVEALKSESRDVDFDVETIYEDDHIMVVNKPPGVVVHPAPSVKEATLVDWLIARGVSLSTISGEERHGIVHRIDKETSGALVVAKNDEAHRILSEELANKSMGRYYIALIDRPLKNSTTIERPIGRNPSNRLKMAIVEGGRSAKTDFVKLYESSSGIELVSARLHTGRTHQIRVHLNSVGRHILGDVMYGYRASGAGKIPRVFLHAFRLYLTHPATGERMEFVAPLFDDMREYLEKNFGRSVCDEDSISELVSTAFGAFDSDNVGVC